MEVIKKINHNAAICIDSAGNEMIAIGTGIGFPPVPYTLDDLSKIQRTYYDINPVYLDLLNQIPEQIFSIAIDIVKVYGEQMDIILSSNLVFTLADHIQFAIERFSKGMIFENPLQYDIQHLYEKEFSIGIYATEIIYQKLNIRLPKAEAANIALHLLNSESVTIFKRLNQLDYVLPEIVEIIGKHFQIYIDKQSVNYSRFVTHFQYLMKREQKSKQISSDNFRLFKAVKKEYPNTFEAVKKIDRYLEKELKFELSEEEQLYLVLHVNRLCSREGTK